MVITAGCNASCYGPRILRQAASMTPRILIAETDRHARSVVRRYVVKGWRGAAVQATSVELEDLLQDGERLRSFDVLLAGCNFSTDGTSNNPTLLTVRALSADPRNPPIILLTEAGSEYTAVQAIRAGAADCIPKGLMGREQVISSIQRVVQTAGPASYSDDRGSEAISLFGYDMRRRLAHHDNASVHVAYSAEHACQVVLKVLHRGRGALSRDENFERFVGEFKLLYDVDDPAVAEIYDFRVTPKYCYMAMEYFPLGHLGTRLSKPVTPEEALELVVEIAHALSIIHAAGVVHLDLKPGNIMLRDDGTVALIDFEISKSSLSDHSISITGEVRGTPYYISPEQARGERPDERSDIYALGIMLFEMLSGRKPYVGETTYAILEQHTSADVPRLPAEHDVVQPLLDKLLAKDPDQRLSSAREVMEAAEQVRAESVEEPMPQMVATS